MLISNRYKRCTAKLQTTHRMYSEITFACISLNTPYTVSYNYLVIREYQYHYNRKKLRRHLF